MKLPTDVLSHHLARCVHLTPQRYQDAILADFALGFSGLTIVPALIDKSITPAQFVKINRPLGARTVVCGFNAGDGPNPLIPEEAPLALAELRRQAMFAVAFAEADQGPAVVVGPTHAHHRRNWMGDWPKKGFDQWIDMVGKLGDELGLRFPLEFLNRTEDGTPEVLDVVLKVASERPESFAIHLDTGHFAMLGHTSEDFDRIAQHVAHFELVNLGREPLRSDCGIDFAWWKTAMAKLPPTCTVGVEPFGQPVIEAFDLRSLCSTQHEGREALALDTVHLRRRLGIMGRSGM